VVEGDGRGLCDMPSSGKTWFGVAGRRVVSVDGSRGAGGWQRRWLFGYEVRPVVVRESGDPELGAASCLGSNAKL
jgi:hypothetical protein